MHSFRFSSRHFVGYVFSLTSWMFLSGCLACCVAACSNGTESSGKPSEADASGADDASLDAPSDDGTTQTDGAILDSIVLTDVDTPDLGKCVADSVEATSYPLDMYLMVDQSASMSMSLGGPENITKWQGLVDAFDAFFKVEHPEFGMGIQFFPLAVRPWTEIPTCETHEDCTDASCILLDLGQRCLAKCEKDSDCPKGSECWVEESEQVRGCSNDQCDPDVYAIPQVPIGNLAQSSEKILTELKAHGPLSMTPTGPAMQGAMIYAKKWALDHPDRRTVVVLATDGRPTVCSQQETATERVDNVIKTMEQGLKHTPSIKTFVIGVEEAKNAISIMVMNEFAKAGGTEKPVIIEPNVDMTSKFAAALEDIRHGIMACEFKIPKSTSALDYNEVNVDYVGKDQIKKPVYYVETASQCATEQGGWYYDTLPSTSQPTKIVLCPKSCELAKSDGARIDFAIGCETMRPPK